METFDIIIAGGGMVGSALAAALGESPLRVALVESALPADPPSADAPFDLRVSALSVASINVLQNVGAWNRILKSGRCCPYRRMRVWEQAGHGDVAFDAASVDALLLGHFVENRIVQHALLECCQQFDNITLIAPDKLSAIHFRDEAVSVELDSGRTLEASLLVGADGGQSLVRARAGIGAHAWDYPQCALVASARTLLPQQDITWQRFTPEGPQAFLPLSGHNASLVWYQTRREAERRVALSEADFIAELTECFPEELGGVTAITDRGLYPLRRMHAQRYFDTRVALVGDAAHTVHPLAGQGVNLGLLDAAALRDVLISAPDSGRDLGDPSLLVRYERARRRDNLAMQTGIDLLFRLFGNDLPPLRLARNFGLALAEQIHPAKQLVTRFALGTLGKGPELARTPSDVA